MTDTEWRETVKRWRDNAHKEHIVQARREAARTGITLAAAYLDYVAAFCSGYCHHDTQECYTACTQAARRQLTPEEEAELLASIG